MASLAVQFAFAGLGHALGLGIPALGLTGAGVGWAVGGIVNSFLFPPPDVNTAGPRLTDLSVTSSSYGKTRPIIYGTVPVGGDIIDASKRYETAHTETQEAGKGGGQKVSHTTYTYSIDLAVALCDGPIEGVLQVFANEKLIYDATPGSKFLKPDWLSMRVYRGTETQNPNPTLEIIHGAGNVPGYRGQAYVVFTRFQLEDFGNQIPTFRFVVVVDGDQTTYENIIDVNPDPWTTTEPNPRDGYAHGLLYVQQTGLIYVGIYNSTKTERQIAAIDPISKKIIWAADGVDVQGAGIHACNVPQLCGIGGNSYIAMLGKHDTSGNNQRVYFVDAKSGYPLKNLPISGTLNSPPNIFSLYTDKTIILAPTVGFALEMSVHWMNPPSYDDDVTGIDKPLGWEWSGNIRHGIKQGSGSTPAVILSLVVDGSNLGFALWEHTQGYGGGGGAYSPSYVIHDIGTSYADIVQIKYDSVRDCFWCYASTPYILIFKVPVDGSAVTQYNWNSLYGHTGHASSTDLSVFCIDAQNGYLWIKDTSGDLWRWDVVNPSDPVEYPATTMAMGTIFVPVTESLWGTATDRVVEYQYDRLGSNTVTLSSIVDDLCDRVGLASADYDTTDLSSVDVRGFAINNIMSARNAIDPLRKAFLFDHADTGEQIAFKRLGQSLAKSLGVDDIGAHAYGAAVPPLIEIERAQELDLPKELSVNYMDVGANYEVGHQRSRILSSSSKQSIAIELPIVLTHSEAAKKAEILLHLSRIERETYAVQVMPAHFDLIPSDVIIINDGMTDFRMRITSKLSEQGVLKFRGVRDEPSVLTSNANGAEITDRAVSIAAEGIMQFVLLNIPSLRDQDMSVGFYAAGYSYSEDWPGGALLKSSDQTTWLEVAAITTTSIVGRVWTVPETASAESWDNLSSLVMTVYAGELDSKTQAEIALGTVNAAAYGDDGRWEIVQFANAAIGSDGLYTVDTLLRGRLGTGRHVNSHQAGDLFVLLDASTLRRIQTQQSDIGNSYYYRGVTFGRNVYDSTNVDDTHGHIGAGMLCYPPAQFRYYTESDLDVVFNWSERTRQIWRNAWSGVKIDPTDYEIDIISGSTVVRTLTATAETVTYTRANQETDFGADTTDAVTARLYQVNEIGRGNYVDLTVELGQYPNPVYKYALSLEPTNYWTLNGPGASQSNSISGGMPLGLSGGYSTGESPGLDDGYSILLNASDYGETDRNDKQLWFLAEQTWSMLIKIGSAPSSNANFAELYGSTPTIEFQITPSRTLRFNSKLGAAWTVMESISALTLGQWYLVTASIGPDGMKIYIDGSVDISNAQTDWDSSGSQPALFVIGDSDWSSTGPIGDVYFDQVMTWHGRQLTDDEVAGLAARMI